MVSDQIERGGVRDERVLQVMRDVPRHAFVGQGMESQAYEDRPLPIGMGQTISQPLMVALQTEALELTGSERILEIGTGSGYQAAVLSRLVTEVFSIERLADLSDRARKVLNRLGYTNINLRIGDGTLGWPEDAPFDGIVVTAGAPVVPEDLIEQLAPKGRLVIPVGNKDVQYLEVIQRTGHGIQTTQRSLTACRFVQLIGAKGWRDDG